MVSLDTMIISKNQIIQNLEYKIVIDNVLNRINIIQFFFLKSLHQLS